MKVLMINGIYGSRSSGRSMQDLTEHLRAAGHSVYIATPQKHCADPCFYRIGNKLDHKLHAFLSRFFGKQAYYSRRATKRFLKWVDEIQPDVVHIQVLHGNFINFNMLIKHLSDKKIPVTFVLDDCWLFTGKCSHYTSAKCYKWKTGCYDCPQLQSCNPSWFFDKTRLLWEDKKRAYESLDKYAVVAVSDWLLAEARQSIMQHATVMCRIYNSIDMQAFCYRPSDLRKRLSLENTFVVLGVATILEESKGLSLFIKLSSMIPESWKIVLVGGLPENAKLPDNVLAVGKTESVKELAEYYSMADAFVQMSVEETFGKVTAEALSCGTPAVVFRSTANPELVGDGCGYVVEPKNVEKVYEALRKIEANGRQAYSAACRAFIEENMDKEKNLGAFTEIYETLLETAKC